MDTPAYDSFADLFPMRMTSIEKFHFWDHHPELPNLIYLRLKVDGRIDPVIAKQAWQIAIQRQPFGDVEPKKIDGNWFWIAGPRAKGDSNQCFEAWNGTRFEFQEHSQTPPAWKLEQHRLRSSTGSYLGISVYPNGGSLQSEEAGDGPSPARSDSVSYVSEVLFYVHHAITDGAGATQTINEWMIIYSNLRSGRPAESGIHRLDSALLQKRNSLGLLTWRYLKHLPKQPIALFGAAKFTFRKTAELIPGTALQSAAKGKDVSDRHYPAIMGQWVSESQIDKLIQKAQQCEVTLNSLLLGQLYLALARWRQKQGVHSDRDWIRIILPMSIRNVSDRRMPAANRATIVQIDRCGRDMKDVAKFYQNLNREISIIRGFQLDKIFLIAIRCLSTFESFLKRAARNEKSRGTAVFTNLGEPLRKSERASAREPESLAHVRPIEFDPVGPIRKGTQANFSVSRYGSRLRISMHYDAQVLSTEQAIGLLGTYLDQLHSVQ